MQSEYIKTVKFGGSSLADAEHFVKVANIIKSDSTRRYVVPSAPGKRFSGDFKVTDKLYELHMKFTQNADWEDTLEIIKNRYSEIISELGTDTDLSNEFDIIVENLKGGADMQYAASRGEYLNGIVLSDYLGFDFVDPANYIRFSDNGIFQPEVTNELLSKELEKHYTAVVPGFYGATKDGVVRTFPRGGSDITGSIVARATSTDIYENWTDVSGFLVADPRIVKNPEVIDIVTYHELRELSYMGANVLHEDSIFPVRASGIPINIRNTNKPEDKGTMIISHTHGNRSSNIITGISGKGGFSVITIEKDMMNYEVGFLRKVLSIFEEYGISVEHMPSGMDSAGIIINTASIEPVKEQVIDEICRTVNPDSIQYDDKLALVAVVGKGMVNVPGTASRIFRAIAANGINVRMIDQGSSEYNIIISVNERDLGKTISAIYDEFFR